MSSEVEVLQSHDLQEDFTNNTKRAANGLKVHFKQGCTPKRNNKGLYGVFKDVEGQAGGTEHKFTNGTVEHNESIKITFNTTAPKLTHKRTSPKWL